mmetsp:Transcript_15815/g.34351  ORF Transcript_15815/g.34351 Transcript_15815/m.34351 type:complete len:152 (-) Transcript_15815:461-916(-)
MASADMPDRDEVTITADELPLGCLASRVVCPTAGAIATFIGTTRDNFDGKTVVRLEVSEAASFEHRCLCCVKNTFLHSSLGACTSASLLLSLSARLTHHFLRGCDTAVRSLSANGGARNSCHHRTRSGAMEGEARCHLASHRRCATGGIVG